MVEYRVDEISSPQTQRKVLRELRRLVETQDFKGAIQEVVVASDFGATVRSFLPEGQGSQYDPVHSYGQAVGKTISIVRNGELHFAVVFDSLVFSDMSNRTLLDRQAVIIHELVHVKNGFLRFENTGSLGNQNPHTKREILFENAWRIWEEYCAQRFAAEVVRETVDSVSEEASIQWKAALDFSNQVLQRLNLLDSQLREEIWKFRIRQSSIDDLVSSTISRIESVVLPLAYIYALKDLSTEVRNEISKLEEDTNFEMFFSAGWAAMLRGLYEYYSEWKTFRADAIEEIGIAFNEILLACGLEMSDVPGGVYFRVLDV